MNRFHFVACTVAAMITHIATEPAAALEPQTFASALNGNDANASTSCQVTAPCRSIATAITNATDDGTVTMLDDGLYEPINISKHITLEGQGAGTRVMNAGGQQGAIYISDSSLRVVLRNFSIDSGMLIPFPGEAGIRVFEATSVSVENVTIRNQTGVSPGAGIWFAPPNNAVLRVKNLSVSNSGSGSTSGGGIVIGTTASGVTHKVSIEDSSFDINSRGIVVSGTGNVQLSISNTTISNSAGHGVYVNQTAGTTRLSIKDSQIVNNAGIGVMVYPKGSASAKVSITNSVVDGNNIGIRSSANGSTGTVVVAVADTSASNNLQNGIYTDGKTNANIIGSTVSGNQNGISAVAPSIVRVGDSLISGNAVGLQGPISSYGNNQLLGNTTQGAKTPVAPGSVP